MALRIARALVTKHFPASPPLTLHPAHPATPTYTHGWCYFRRHLRHRLSFNTFSIYPSAHPSARADIHNHPFIYLNKPWWLVVAVVFSLCPNLFARVEVGIERVGRGGQVGHCSISNRVKQTLDHRATRYNAMIRAVIRATVTRRRSTILFSLLR